MKTNFMRRVAIAALVAFCYMQAFGSFNNYFYDRFETAIADFWFSLRGALPAPTDVVIVGITAESYQVMDVPSYQRWPREYLAKALDKLRNEGAATVAMDLVFKGQGPNPEGDKLLAEAMKAMPVYIVKDQIKTTDYGPTGERGMVEKLSPYSLFEKSAKGAGIVTGIPSGHIIRGFPFGTIRSWNPRGSLSFMAASALKNMEGMPTDFDMVKWYGDTGSSGLTVVPVERLLGYGKELPSGLFNQKIVFIGEYQTVSDRSGTLDIINTPITEKIPGVVWQATATANLLNNDWIKRGNQSKEGLYTVIFLALTAFILISLQPVTGGIFLTFCLIGWSLFSYRSFLAGHFYGGALATIVFLPATYLGSAAYYYFVASRSQREIRRIFSRYLAPAMVEKLAEDPASLKLGGELRHCSVLFTDMAGFTTFSEKLPPQELVSVMNSYFDVVAGAVLENQGTLIRFTGDGFLAIWGAPLESVDHAGLALKAARKIEGLTEKKSEKIFMMTTTRVGIHCGDIVVGNIGNAARIDYTVAGDAVNLASRLETLNKKLGTRVLISGDLVSHLNDPQGLYYLGKVRVAGRSEAVPIYTLTGSSLPDQKLFSDALSLFEVGDLAAARDKFKEIAVKAPGQSLSLLEVYLSQIDQISERQLAQGLQGELIFSDK